MVTLPRDADTPELIQAINALITTVDKLDKKVNKAIEDRQEELREQAEKITRLQTEMTFVKWIGGAVGAATILMLIERISKLI